MSKITKALNIGHITDTVLRYYSPRDFADLFKAIFDEDTQVFTDVMQGVEIAQQEIAIEIEEMS